MKKYWFFLKDFNEKREMHNLCLGKDSTTVMDYFDALKASILAQTDYNSFDGVFSTYREEFMLRMLKKEVLNNMNTTIISINGHAHIDLDDKDKRVTTKNYKPLAYLLKKELPEIKICSIYLLNRTDDLYFQKDYPNEYKYLMENTEPNMYYITKIDYAGSPLLRLAEKYTYIVIY